MVVNMQLKRSESAWRPDYKLTFDSFSVIQDYRSCLCQGELVYPQMEWLCLNITIIMTLAIDISSELIISSNMQPLTYHWPCTKQIFKGIALGSCGSPPCLALTLGTSVKTSPQNSKQP